MAPVNRFVRDIGAVAGFGWRRVQFPTETVIQCKVRAQFEFILSEDVVLFGALPLRPQRYTGPGTEGQKRIVTKVAHKHLAQAGRNAQKVVDGSLQAVQVGCRNAGCSSVSNSGKSEGCGGWPGNCRKGNSWGEAGASHVAALIVVLIHSNVQAESHNMLAT